MIPPNKYLTFSHTFLGSASYTGTENFKKLYVNFLRNPSLNKCQSFSNQLSDIELQILNEGFCIIFVLPTRYAWKDSWESLKPDLDKLMNFIEKFINEDNLIVAWDVLFKRVQPKLKSAYAIIGIEHIIDIPFNDKFVMVPGNIFITNNGKIVGNGLNVENCIELFKSVYGENSSNMIMTSIQN
ncbi:hypothetical protein QKU48_gp1335 [Fadolivirus algeromassiliense]|jgi:hypothetical protein|uniref:Uncharacterized protein n=1 Tax=Fadolivirus FV1/VV64 TaxID=3070911 RepID=A0A7D3URM4_9VIRU|nr:hypothetical protein QKU48_gp1335 [Fadolivirus algeromassiliense]QKF94793.1 hypothetical protein Fadolivirus_1_1335 [Fadolivirus FV1/VV64]